MLVRKHLRWTRILYNTRGFLAYMIILSSFVFLGDRFLVKGNSQEGVANSLLRIPFPPIAMLAGALAIFLAFRNNSAYDRWWEARKIWGGIVNRSRTIARQVTSLASLSSCPQDEISSFKKEFVYRHLAWINALRLQLRDDSSSSSWAEVRSFLSEDEFEWLCKRQNKATQLVQKQGIRLSEARQHGLLIEARYLEILDDSLTDLYDLQGKAERIKRTPLARQYDYFPRVFLYVFVTLLPFGLISELAKSETTWLVVLLAPLVSFVFYVLMKVGEFNEDPFESRFTDTPMSALCRTIEIDLREQLGETELPAPLQPVDGILM